MITNVTIGADPELFIMNGKTGKVVSAVGLIPGEKGNPWVGEDMPNGFGLETDNILAEFNIPPVRDKTSFVNNIEYMKEYINKFVKEKDPDLGILCKASMTVDRAELKSKQAKEFGCEPDYNVYTEDVNPKPKNASRTTTRSAGFHIHIGYENHNIDESLRLIKYLDAYLGVPSIQFDGDKKRRSLYGKAGCFRLTSYGVEYRCLSSALMENTDRLSFVWDQTIKAIEAYNYGRSIPDPELVCDAINNSNIELANVLISRYDLM